MHHSSKLNIFLLEVKYIIGETCKIAINMVACFVHVINIM